MFKLNDGEVLFISLVLEGFLYGLYSGMFAMYLKYQAPQKDIDKKRNIVFYSICALYALSIALFFADIALPTYNQLLSKPMDSVLRIYFINMALFGCCDFIAQFILIYRCWIVWGRNIHVVIIPSILTFVFLVLWLAGGISSHSISSNGWVTGPSWGPLVIQLGLALSLTVNALVTGLIVFKIFKVFRQVKASNDQILRATDRSKLRRIILILIESGMALFSIQLVGVVVTFINTDAAIRTSYIIIVIHDMLIGITPTIILVRTSMGLSFDDKKSVEEFANGSLGFEFNHPNSVTQSGIVAQDRRDNDVGVRRSNDIEIVER